MRSSAGGPGPATGQSGPRSSRLGALRLAESARRLAGARHPRGANRVTDVRRLCTLVVQPARAEGARGAGWLGVHERARSFVSIAEVGERRLARGHMVRLRPRHVDAGEPELVQASAVARRRDGASRATGSRRMGDHTPPLADRRGLLVHQPLPFHAARVTRGPGSLGPVSPRKGRGRCEPAEASEALESLSS